MSCRSRDNFLTGGEERAGRSWNGERIDRDAPAWAIPDLDASDYSDIFNHLGMIIGIHKLRSWMKWLLFPESEKDHGKWGDRLATSPPPSLGG